MTYSQMLVDDGNLEGKVDEQSEEMQAPSGPREFYRTLV